MHTDFSCACDYVATVGVLRAQPHTKVIIVTKKNIKSLIPMGSGGNEKRLPRRYCTVGIVQEIR